MIFADYNKMTLEELEIISKALRREYIIEDGRITEASDVNEKED